MPTGNLNLYGTAILPIMKRLWALLRQCCPVCLQGHSLRRSWHAHALPCLRCRSTSARPAIFQLHVYLGGRFPRCWCSTAVLFHFLDVSIPVFSLIIIGEMLLLTLLIFSLRAYL